MQAIVPGSPMRGYPRNRLTIRPADEVVVTRTTPSRGFTISYEDAGQGPTIVLIPGLTMSAADWRDAGYVDQLAVSHRVLSVDPLGNGLSDKPHDPDAYAYPGVAADVLAVMDSAGVDRATVWGYSRGAALALALATEFRDRTASVILSGGGDLTKDVPKGSPQSAQSAQLSRGDWETIWGKFDFSEADRRYDVEFNDPLALGAIGFGASRSGVAFDPGGIRVPALVYIGGNDEPEEERKTAAALGVECHVLADLDHLQGFSRIDLVMPVVLAFLVPLGL
jgi:pimeloyl-ACP methyl ester carboxylesterase